MSQRHRNPSWKQLLSFLIVSSLPCPPLLLTTDHLSREKVTAQLMVEKHIWKNGQDLPDRGGSTKSQNNCFLKRFRLRPLYGNHYTLRGRKSSSPKRDDVCLPRPKEAIIMWSLSSERMKRWEPGISDTLPLFHKIAQERVPIIIMRANILF